MVEPFFFCVYILYPKPDFLKCGAFLWRGCERAAFERFCAFEAGPAGLSGLAVLHVILLISSK